MISPTLSSTDTRSRLTERLQQQVQHRPRVLISACLAGQTVRYDGQPKTLAPALAPLIAAVDLIQHCPEMDAGMGVPREPIHWVQTAAGGPQLQWVHAPHTPMDYPLREKAEHWCRQHPDLTAAILKARSPSCGHGTTPLMDRAGETRGWIDGVFTDRLKRSRPQIAIIDETYFCDQRTHDCNGHWFVLGVYLAQLQREGAAVTATLSALTPWAGDLSRFLATAPQLREEYLLQLMHSEW